MTISMSQTIDDFETEVCRGWTVHDVLEVLGFLPYGAEIRLMIQWYVHTGCRPSEIDRMFIDNLIITKYGWVQEWMPGKENALCKKKKPRREIIPDYLVAELRAYRDNSKVPDRKLFGMTYKTLRKNFTRDVRPYLSDRFRQRVNQVCGDCEDQHLLQLKGIRKTWATLKFAQEIQRWGSSEVALEMTSKRMRHSSKQMTSYYYLQNFRSLEVHKYAGQTYADIFRLERQKRLKEYN